MRRTFWFWLEGVLRVVRVAAVAIIIAAFLLKIVVDCQDRHSRMAAPHSLRSTR